MPVNDVHSGLNSTLVSQILTPGSLDEVRAALKLAREEERAICISGARHAMGQQAFATDGILLDMRKMSRVLGFDTGRGLIEVEAGMHWPQLLNELSVAQRGDSDPWTFAQKQPMDPQGAVTALRKAIELAPAGSPVVTSANYLLGIAAFQRVVQLDPEAQRGKSCDIARQMQALLQESESAFTAGRASNATQTDQYMGYVRQYQPRAASMVKAYCG